MSIKEIAELVAMADALSGAVVDCVKKIEERGASEAAGKAIARFMASYYHEMAALKVPEPVIIASLSRFGK